MAADVKPVAPDEERSRILALRVRLRGILAARNWRRVVREVRRQHGQRPLR